jgi:hypothetical protein
VNISTKQKIAAALGIATAGMLASSIAYAAWTKDNSASAAKGKAQDINFTVASATATADVYPGVDGALNFTVTNNRPFAITVTNLDATAATLATAASCDATLAGHSVAVTAAMGGGLSTVAGNGGTRTFTVPGAFTWNSGTGSNNACQGTDITTSNATVTATAF